MMTKGEYRVGIDFNPSSNPDVDRIKQAAAELIDMIEAIDNRKVPEAGRCKAEAQTCIETGAMWAVKAITKKPED
jgi:hypothetical protein